MPGILLTIIGMGVVFGSLIILMVLIQLLDRFFGSGLQENDKNAKDAKASPENEDMDIVLAAAVGYFLETEGPEIHVPQVRRGADSLWARTARPGHFEQRRRR